ncbi:MAG: ribonuclease HII [Gallicola sp.]|uniref:ribonuclease HII n=1 Tax=Gallicola sp. Sow4_E12 TaxID=3438785 RepID=UPI0018222432|nr:ribonuclease HII [Gallicola sp.]
MFDFSLEEYEKKYNLLAGVDEVGRGPLAGPVVACAVIMPKGMIIEGVKDSKKLTPKKRDMLDLLIREHALGIGIGIEDEKSIDEINIKQATRKAMKTALDNIFTKEGEKISADIVFVDAEKIDCQIPQESLIKGDDRCFIIACASIVAKVLRDKMMVEYEEQYPGYDFAKNKGYGTKKHREALLEIGPCSIHRKTFLRKILHGKV